MVEASESSVAERAAATIVDVVLRDLGEPGGLHVAPHAVDNMGIGGEE
jgi:hypothetical protein